MSIVNVLNVTSAPGPFKGLRFESLQLLNLFYSSGHKKKRTGRKDLTMSLSFLLRVNNAFRFKNGLQEGHYRERKHRGGGGAASTNHSEKQPLLSLLMLETCSLSAAF